MTAEIKDCTSHGGCSPDSNSKVTQQHVVLASPALPVAAVCGVALALSTMWLSPTKGGVKTDKPHVPQRKRAATAGTYRDQGHGRNPTVKLGDAN